jgi:glycosyltransferase involved in cell wall biosynthesis
MKVSLVLVSKDEREYVRPFFHTLKLQTRKPEQIILVDSSTDGTFQIAEQFVDKSFWTPPAPVGYCRQVGFENSTGDIIIFTDLDALLNPFWIENLVKMFENPEVNVVRGTVRYREIKDKIPKKFTTIHHCNTAYRRKVLEEFPFDEECNHDDIDMNERVGRKYKIYGCPEAIVLHIGSFAKTSAKEKARRYAEADIYLLKKYKTLFMFFRPFANALYSMIIERRIKYNFYYIWFYTRGLI